MISRLRLAAALVLVALTLPAPPPARAAGGLATTAPAPDRPGPFAVGRVSFPLTDTARGRTLQIDVWYPVDPVYAGGPKSRYEFSTFGGLEAPLAFAGPPISKRERWPLVVFSHGNGGVRYQSYFLTETLASHGFVVASPDHTGNTFFDLLGGPSPIPLLDMAVMRIEDVKFLITTMLGRNATAGDAFAGTIDAARVGVTGHSFGGFTTIGVKTGFAGRVAADPRVRAIAPLAPAASVFSDADLASITVPTLVIGGTLDETTPLVPESTRPAALVGSRSAYRAWIEDAGHFSFSNICDIAQILVALGLPAEQTPGYDEGCTPELIPIGEAHRIIELYVVSFFRVALRHDLRYLGYLGAPYAARYEPDVDFAARPGSVGVR